MLGYALVGKTLGVGLAWNVWEAINWVREGWKGQGFGEGMETRGVEGKEHVIEGGRREVLDEKLVSEPLVTRFF